MATRNDINYGTVGGYESTYSPAEIGLGQDWDAKALILAEQERARAQQGQWRGRKAAPHASGISVEGFLDDGTLYLRYGQKTIAVSPDDVDDLAAACAKAIYERNKKNRTYGRYQSMI